MKTHLEFRSSAFPPYPEEEEQINPGLFGRRLAEFLVERLKDAGFNPDEPGPEDWGWYITVENPNFPLWIGCGHYQEYEDGFLCFIEPSKPVVRRWFRKVSTEAMVSRIASVLESSLGSHPAVYGLRWWSDDETAHGGA